MWRRLSPTVLLLVVLAGCAALSPSEDQAASLVPVDVPTPPQTTEPTVAGDDAIPVGEAIEPAPNGVLRVAVVGPPVLDPSAASMVVPTDMVALDLLYDGLTDWDTEIGAWVPALAESLEPAQGGKVWTVRLGAHRFSDGSPILASDVVASIEHVLDAEDSVVAGRLDAVREVSVIDERTVYIGLDRPDRQLPSVLSSPLLGVAPSGEFDGRYSSGPMAMTTTDAGDLEFRRRPGVDAALDAVRFVAVDDEGAAVDAVSAGRADVAYVPPSYPGEVDARVASTVDVFFVVNESAWSGDAATRSAALATVDAAALAAAGIGDGVVALPWVPVAACEGSCADDPAVSGVAPSTTVSPIDVMYLDDDEADSSVPGDRAMSELVADLLTDAGQPASAVGLSIDDLVAALAAGEQGLVRGGAVGLFPDDAGRFGLLWPGGPEDLTGGAHPAIAARVERALRLGTEAAVRALESAVAESGLIVPVGRIEVRAIVDDRIAGLVLDHDGTFDLGPVTAG